MKVCFPVSQNKGLESPVYGHFGSAPMFLLIDAKERSVANVINRDINHRHGSCRPLKAIGGHQVDAVVVGGIGAGALSGLQLAGYKVYQATDGSIAENLDRFAKKQLSEQGPGQTCNGQHKHHCAGNHDEPDIEFGCGF
jgi:predicted Fe-Mo cluster-binding NifX family protein